MAENTIKARIKIPSKTTTQWNNTTTLPKVGELLYDSTEKKLKIGDGTSTAKQLPYLYGDVLDQSNAFVADIHNSTDTTKTATAKQIWEECEKRNVSFEVVGDTSDVTSDENDFIAKYAYGVGWVDKTSVCERIGNLALHSTLPVHESLRACTTTFEKGTFTVTEDGQTITYGGKHRFKNWLNPINWYEYIDGTDATADIEGNCDVWIYNSDIYYKSFKLKTKGDVTTTGNYNMVFVSTKRYDGTWSRLKAGYTSFTKIFREDGHDAGVISMSSQRVRSHSSSKSALYSTTGPRYNDDITNDQLKAYLEQTGICRASVSSNRLRVHEAALNSGCHMMSYDEYKVLFYWLPLIEYCSFMIECNSVPADNNTLFNTGDVITRDDKTLSYGYPMLYTNTYSTTLNVASVRPWSSVPAGYCNELGSRTGWIRYKTSDNKLPIVKYRGFEIGRQIWINVFGCFGLSIETGKTDFYTSRNRAKWDNTDHSSDDDYKKIGTQNWNGGIEEFALNSTAEIVPESAAVNRKYDYSYGAIVNGPTWLIFGGASDRSPSGGPGCFHSSYVAGGADTDVSFRIRFNIDEYKTIYN